MHDKPAINISEKSLLKKNIGRFYVRGLWKKPPVSLSRLKMRMATISDKIFILKSGPSKYVRYCSFMK